MINKKMIALFSQTLSERFLQELCPEITFPFPNAGMAGSPDFLAFITAFVLRHTPSIIFEVGSGISTVYLAACLKKNGKGTLISLDHERRFANETQKLLEQYQLASFVSLHTAPLRSFRIGKQDWLWYDFEPYLNNIHLINLMIVDGPPEKIQAQSRYPAVPLIWNKLSKGSTLILDDTRRSDEQAIMRRWKKEFNLSFELLEHERGTGLITLS
jgi:hypothetical protein